MHNPSCFKRNKMLIFVLLASVFVRTAFAVETGAPGSVSEAAEATLTLQEAEALALRNNPKIKIAQLLTLAEKESVRQARSAELPTVTANLTAVESHEGSRLAAGALNNPIVYERAAGGLTLSQLLTDFGRTKSLVAEANWRAKSRQEREMASGSDLVLAVDQAFYRALAAQAVVRIATQNVRLREETSEQVSALSEAKLKSDLDKSFAQVNLSQAKLLLLNAQNAEQETMTTLCELLGLEVPKRFRLQEESASALPLPPDSSEGLVSAAFQARPDLQSVVDSSKAAAEFQSAEHSLWKPTISAAGSAGSIPVRADAFASSWYGAVGVNVQIPVWNGFQFQSRAKESDYRSNAATEEVRALKNSIARDVRTAVLNAQSSFQKIAVSEQLLQQANLALDLAKARYQIGLSTIVELSEAQLQQTEAEIGNANARYSYQASLAILRYQTGQ